MLRKPGEDRKKVAILAFEPHHEEKDILTAVEMVLGVGVPTKTQVLNVVRPV